MRVFQKSLLVSTSLLSMVYGVWAMDNSTIGDEGKQKGEISGKATSKPQSNKTLTEEGEISSIKQASDLYYRDDDISGYIRIFIENNSTFTYFNGSKYLLSSKLGQFAPIMDRNDNNEYIVAVHPAIDTLGRNQMMGAVSSTNIGYFLDRSSLPKDQFVITLEELVNFKSTSAENPYNELLQKVEDLKKNNSRLEGVDDLMEGQGENVPHIQSKFREKLEEIRRTNNDVFDEIIPSLLSSKLSHAKILFPYNRSQIHWLTGEIRIHKEDNDYKIQIYAHDPYGGGKMQDNFLELQETIQRRIQELHNTAIFSFDNPESLYGRRQAQGDVISCGTITAEDLLARIIGTPLGGTTYPLGAKGLRNEHIRFVEEKEPGASFISRNKPKAAFITQYENELGNLTALLNKLKYPKNEGNYSNLGIASKDHNSVKQFSNETFEKLEEIIRQISRIKKNHEKIESDPSSKGSLLKDIKESLLRISWRVDEIPSYDKFHMGAVFPEKNWILLGYLSNALNSNINSQQLEIALLSLSKEIEEIEKAIVIINKILKKEDLKKEAQIQLKLPCLENFVGFYMDQLLLEKINSSISSIVSHIKNENDIERFLQNEENRRAIFRVFEVIGECAKYISCELKDIYPSIPWLDFSPEIKKNILTIIRNKFHHDREKIELVFKHEKDLLKSILNTAFPYILQKTKKASNECDTAYSQLSIDDFMTLRDSVHKKLSSNISGSIIPTQLSETQNILEQITDIMFKQEDESTTLKGWKIKELLSYIKEEDDSIYGLLFKKVPLPNTEDEFVELIRQQLIDSTSFSLDLETKFRKAYARLQGKKISQQQINDAFQQGSPPPTLSINEIKEGIRGVIIGGKPCISEKFRKSFINPIFFKGIEQKEGEKKLEELRSLVSVNTSNEEIEELFRLSDGDMLKVQEESSKTLVGSNAVKEKFKDIATLPKNKITKKDIVKLIGLSNEDQEALLEILAKDPPPNVGSEEVKKKFASSLEIKEKIINNIKIDKKPELGKLINLTKEEQEIIWKIINLPSEKKTEEGNRKKIEEILDKCPKSLEEYQSIYKDEYNKKYGNNQRSQADIENAQSIINKVINGPGAFKNYQEENRAKIKATLLKTKPIIQEKEFDLLIKFLCYTDSLVNKIRAKYKNILTQNSNLEERLNVILDSIDENITPLSCLKTVLENSWLSPDEKLSYFQHLVAEVQLDWRDFQPLYKKKRGHSLTEQDISDEIKKLKQLKYNLISKNIDKGMLCKIESINNLKMFIKNLKIGGSEKEFRDLVEATELIWKDFQPLYEKKTNDSLTEQDITSEVKKIKQLKYNFVSEKLDKDTLYKIEKLNHLKMLIKNLGIRELEKGFWDIVEAAGLSWNDFQRLYSHLLTQGNIDEAIKKIGKEAEKNDRIVEKINNLKSLLETAGLSWEDFQHLYEKKRDHLLIQNDIDEAIRKTDGEIGKNNLIIKNLNHLKSFLENLTISESKEIESDFKKFVEEAKLQWQDFQPLYEMKKSNSLIELGEGVKKAKSRISNEIEKIKSLINKINNLKDGIKKLILLSEDSLRALVEKAGYSYEEKFQDLYEIITYKSIGEPPLEQLKGGLIESINKLGSIFEELGSKALDPNRSKSLKMSAEYLIEEIGPAAEKLVNRLDYVESEYLSTSRRNLYLIAMCRKAMAHYPLSIDENLMNYLIDQLVLDTKLRLGGNHSNGGILSKDVVFEKTRRVAWNELDQKRTEIHALVEGLGFKNDFKIFGKSLGCDVGVQGDLNLLVSGCALEAIDTLHLIELETSLARELNCDVRVFTDATLASRLGLKVLPEHMAEIKKQATYTLEDIIRGNKFQKIFEEGRWSTFQLLDGRNFSRSQYLEQQDLKKLFSFLLGEKYSFATLEVALSNNNELFGIILSRLVPYNDAPKEHSTELSQFFNLLKERLCIYHTQFIPVKIPISVDSKGIIEYRYVTAVGTHPQDGLLTLEDLPELMLNQTLPEFMHPLYTITSSGFQRADQKFQAVQGRILIQKPIENINIKLIAQEICEIILKNKRKILDVLSFDREIKKEMLFKANSIEYAFLKEEKDPEKTRDFRKKRLADNENLRSIIYKKAGKYLNNIINELDKIQSKNQISELLNLIFLEKKIDQILKIYYQLYEDKITFLWNIMDEQQRKLQGDLKIPSLVVSSFEHFKILTESNLNLIEDKGTQELLSFLLSKKNHCLQLFNNTQQQFQQPKMVSASAGRILTQHEIQSLLSNFVSFSTLPNKLDAKKYYYIFSRIINPTIIEILIANNGNLIGSTKEDDRKRTINLIQEDLTQQYCEMHPYAITLNCRNRSKKIIDFSSEVEYENFRERSKIKTQLENELQNNTEKYLVPLKEFVLGKKNINLPRDCDTILGYGNSEIALIHDHISNSGHPPRRVPNIPDFLTEEIPSFLGENELLGIGIRTGINGTSKFTTTMTDLNNLMEAYGWTPEEREAYKKHNNFEYDNQLIKEYYEFRSYYDQLSETQKRAQEYKRKIEDLKERFKDIDKFSAYQQLKLKEKLDFYSSALSNNEKTQESFLNSISVLPFTQRRIEEALQNPYFLKKVYDSAQKDRPAEQLEHESQRLREKALQELGAG